MNSSYKFGLVGGRFQLAEMTCRLFVQCLRSSWWNCKWSHQSLEKNSFGKVYWRQFVSSCTKSTCTQWKRNFRTKSQKIACKLWARTFFAFSGCCWGKKSHTSTLDPKMSQLKAVSQVNSHQCTLLLLTAQLHY
jgi:hypothetical protein